MSTEKLKEVDLITEEPGAPGELITYPTLPEQSGGKVTIMNMLTAKDPFTIKESNKEFGLNIKLIEAQNANLLLKQEKEALEKQNAILETRMATLKTWFTQSIETELTELESASFVSSSETTTRPLLNTIKLPESKSSDAENLSTAESQATAPNKLLLAALLQHDKHVATLRNKLSAHESLHKLILSYFQDLEPLRQSLREAAEDLDINAEIERIKTAKSALDATLQKSYEKLDIEFAPKLTKEARLSDIQKKITDLSDEYSQSLEQQQKLSDQLASIIQRESEKHRKRNQKPEEKILTSTASQKHAGTIPTQKTEEIKSSSFTSNTPKSKENKDLPAIRKLEKMEIEVEDTPFFPKHDVGTELLSLTKEHKTSDIDKLLQAPTYKRFVRNIPADFKLNFSTDLLDLIFDSNKLELKASGSGSSNFFQNTTTLTSQPTVRYICNKLSHFIDFQNACWKNPKSEYQTFFVHLMNTCHTRGKSLDKWLFDALIEAAVTQPHGHNIVKMQDKQGNTLLHWAAWTFNTSAFETLLKHGANANSVNNAGRTPIIHMCTRDTVYEAEACELALTFENLIITTKTAFIGGGTATPGNVEKEMAHFFKLF